ncbi:MAG TPA: CYTH domain-containing protein [Hyphomicrobiaceae bacterium]|jgi:adenylate cyclase|nr:CYTH domain-containing protein [Hyphomicrobiaceae bacterium]
MAFEIERKFLVRSQEWRTLATAQTRVRQAYLAGGDKSSTRVRIKDDVAASLTIKARGVGLRRLEVEVPISLIDGEALLSLRQSSLIEKIRHEVPWQRKTWEIDVFAGDNAGLIVAEIELGDEREVFERPPWLGPEVTGQTRYYNSALAQRPYATWQKTAGLLGTG